MHLGCQSRCIVFIYLGLTLSTAAQIVAVCEKELAANSGFWLVGLGSKPKWGNFTLAAHSLNVFEIMP